MLVLSRKMNQSITIGSDIRVFVIALARDHVKLGIEAPQDLRVRRSEVAVPPVGKGSAEEDKLGDARGR